MLHEQLSVEVCARSEAQTRVQRLLQQNTDLLQHISLLVKQIQELELKAAGQLTSSERKSAFIFTSTFFSIYSIYILFLYFHHISSPCCMPSKNNPVLSSHCLSPLLPVFMAPFLIHFWQTINYPHGRLLNGFSTALCSHVPVCSQSGCAAV